MNSLGASCTWQPKNINVLNKKTLTNQNEGITVEGDAEFSRVLKTLNLKGMIHICFQTLIRQIPKLNALMEFILSGIILYIIWERR